MNAVKTLPERARLGIITFSNVISVYEIGISRIASAQVFGGMAFHSVTYAIPMPKVLFKQELRV